MRHRRRHRDDWSLPSGLAEVDLFRFWEADLADDLPADLVALPPAKAQVPTPVPVPGDVWGSGSSPSTAPLWWATALVALVVLIALLV
jgi:hypothetical protein